MSSKESSSVGKEFLRNTAVALVAIALMKQASEAAKTGSASASELGPTPAEVPTPEKAMEEMRRFERTIEEVNQGPQITSQATPAAAEIQPGQQAPEGNYAAQSGKSLSEAGKNLTNQEAVSPSYSIRVETNSGDFTSAEAEFITSQSEKILKTWGDIFGQPFREDGVITIKKGDWVHPMWCTEDEIFYRQDVSPFDETDSLVHEWTHVLGGEWPLVLRSLFGTGETDGTVRSMNQIISYKLGIESSMSKLESDIIFRAYDRDPDFFLSFRRVCEQEGCSLDSSREKLMSLAERASPGFSQWLEFLEKGPQIELPEPTEKIFRWRKLPPIKPGRPASIMWVYPELVRHPIGWPGEWEGTAYGISWRVDKDLFEGYVIVTQKQYPRLGPEGTLPYYNFDDILSQKPLGYWK